MLTAAVIQLLRTLCEQLGYVVGSPALVPIALQRLLLSNQPITLIDPGRLNSERIRSEGEKRSKDRQSARAYVLLCKSVHVKLTIPGVGLRAQRTEIPA